MNALPRRAQVQIGAGVLAVVVAGLIISALFERSAPPASTGITRVEDAVSLGVLDQQVVDELRAKGEAVGFVSIDIPQLIARIEQQFPDVAQRIQRDDAIAAAIGQAKEQLKSALADRAAVVVDYDRLSSIAIRFQSESALLLAVRLPVVGAIRTDDTGGADLDQSKILVRAGEVQRQGFGGQGTYVAVFDTGVETAGNESWFPAGSLAGSYRATDPVRGDADGSATASGHGTHVASTVLAVAPATRILAIEVFRQETAEADGPSWSRGRILDGIRYVVGLKNQHLRDPSQCCNVVAMNLSLGRRGVHHLTTCVDDFSFAAAWRAGIVIVTSAGNKALMDGVFTPGVGYPACNPYALNVGATTDGVFGESTACNGSTSPDRPAIFSQTGEALRIFAPGSCILAAGGAKQGTSMAAPHVAGAVAALASAKSTATNEEIWNALADSGRPIVDTRTTPTVTRNRLDVAAALQVILGAQARPGSPASPINRRSFTVGPSTLALPYDARPGRSYVLESFGVRNTGAEPATYTFAIEESDLAFAEVAPAPWFRFVPDTITLQPGESSFVEPHLQVSGTASNGGYAAFIRPVDSAAADLLGPAVRVTFDVGDAGDVGVGEPQPDNDGLPLVVIVVVVGVIVGLFLLRRRSTKAA